TTMNLSWAAAGAAPRTTKARRNKKARLSTGDSPYNVSASSTSCPRALRPGVSRPSTSLLSKLKTWMPGTRPGMTAMSHQQLSRDERPRLRRARCGEKLRRRRAFDHAAAVEQDDVAGQTPRLAEVVGRHDHLDAARGDGANDVFDRLGGGGVEAPRRPRAEQ